MRHFVMCALLAGCVSNELSDYQQPITEEPVSIMSDAGSSAPMMTKETTNNVQKTYLSFGGDLFDTIVTPPTKPTQIKTRGRLTATSIDPWVEPAMFTNAAGGTCVKIANPPAGYMIGSGGADPCVIAVIVTSTAVYVCHFSAVDQVGATLDNLKIADPDAHAAIAGGNNTDPSNITLDDLLTGLDRRKIRVDGILDRTGVYWDPTNQRFVYGPLDKPSVNR